MHDNDPRKRLIPGHPIPAPVINLIADFAEMCQRLGVAAPLNLTDLGIGKVFADGRLPTFTARLSGSNSPYAFAEVYQTVAHDWTTLTDGRTGTAYEYNAVAGLDGAVVDIEWSSAGDWRFYVPRPGRTLGVLKGCNGLVLPNASGTVKLHSSGVTLGTFSTNSSGAISGIGGLTPGLVVDIVVNRFAPATVTVASGPSLGVVNLFADSSHVCVTGCAYPVKTTLTFTSSLYGTFTANFTTAVFPHVWKASGTVNFAGSSGAPHCPPAAGVAVTWTLDTALAMDGTYSCNGPFSGCPATAPGVATCDFLSLFATFTRSLLTCPTNSALLIAVYSEGSIMNSGTTPIIDTWSE